MVNLESFRVSDECADGEDRRDYTSLQDFARKLEGYDAADLRALVERAMHKALMRRLASRPRPTGAFLRICCSIPALTTNKMSLQGPAYLVSFLL